MLTHDGLKRLVTFDPETGIFDWHPGRKSMRRNALGGIGWTSKGGYWTITVMRKRYPAHRLAWFYVHGEWPSDDIDHINRDKLDNRISNLRPATRSQNLQNKLKGSTNKSGFKGVSLVKKTGRWRSCITVGRKQIALGTYSTPEEAAKAYEAGALMLHSHACPDALISANPNQFGEDDVLHRISPLGQNAL